VIYWKKTQCSPFPACCSSIHFTEINLPENNEAESHGFVTYRIQPISGTASIFFDFNPPIITNTEVNTVYDCSDLERKHHTSVLWSIT
jgi:hypothetical protein